MSDATPKSNANPNTSRNNVVAGAPARGAEKALDAKSVRELQDFVGEAAPHVAPGPTGRFSRAADLHLIDELSRKSSAGLAVLAGAAIFAAVLFGGGQPVRASVWLVLVSSALYACRRLVREFRAGGDIAAQPFRWRANYASSLAVLSAAMGAGAILLAPVGTPAAATTQLIPLLAAALAVAAASHTAHLTSALALIVPGFFFIAPSAARAFGAAPMAAVVVFFAVAGAAVAVMGASRRNDVAMRRFPRTYRRLVEDSIAPSPAITTGLSGDLAGDLSGDLADDRNGVASGAA